MATTLDAILKLRERLNKNNINDNIASDKPRAISILNESQLKYLRHVLDNKNKEIIREVQFLLKNKSLSLDGKISGSVFYKLPTDLFDISYPKVTASSGKCRQDLFTWEVKSQNVPELLVDSNNKPSWYYRETFYHLENKKLRIYVDDFDVTKVMLNYYRYPKLIDISGYIKADETESSDSNPEWSDYSLDKIIDIAVRDYNINSENLQRFRVDNNRIVQNF